MGNRETSADVVFEYTGDGCSVPKNVTCVQFNEGLQKIGHTAFFNCTSLESITIPSTVTEIGSNAFNSCINLREVIVNDGLTKVGHGVFSNCTSLKSITLPSTITEIDTCAFKKCSNLREVTFNDGLQKIGGWAFYKCTSLESITLPPTLTAEISNDAFGDCRNLKELILNDGLQKIGISAFYNCTSLKRVILPPTLVEIGMNAFHSCSNLREVELNGALQYGINMFGNCDALERFLFPTISYRIENIIQTSHWEELEDKLNEVHGVVQWESDELFVSRVTPQNWDDISRDIGKITRLVSYYELKDATTTFELALWKSKLDQADASNTTNRAAYRIDVPGPVKDTILQYLDHI